MLQPRPYFSLKKLKEVDGFRGVDDVDVPAEESDLVDVYSYLTRPLPVKSLCGCGHGQPQALDYAYNENELAVKYVCLSCSREFIVSDMIPDIGDEVSIQDDGGE